MLGAYVQSVTEVSRMSIKERSLEPIITINKKVYEKSKENEKNPREDKENISSNNLSEIWHQS
jgi:hypothetical protein